MVRRGLLANASPPSLSCLCASHSYRPQKADEEREDAANSNEDGDERHIELNAWEKRVMYS